MNLPVITYQEYLGKEYPQQFVWSCQRVGIVPVVIGDHKWEGADNVLHLANSDCARKFEQRYVHCSPNSVEFELRCFTRWFYIRELVRERKITKFLHLDSDVLLLMNPSCWNDSFVGDVLTTRCSTSGTFSLGVSVITSTALEVICEHFEANASGNDMVRFSELAFHNKLAVFDMALPVNNVAADHHVADTWKWESVMPKYPAIRRKKLLMGDGMCYAIHQELGPVRLMNLHCWSAFKECMELWMNRIYA